MRFVGIVILCIVMAVLYGIVHDQITARICVEYFTIGHPPVFGTDDPTLLGLGWGIIATWWVGAILGVILAAAACVGPWPKLDAQKLMGPLALMLLIVCSLAALSGVVGYGLAGNGSVHLIGDLATRVPADKHRAFLTDL